MASKTDREKLSGVPLRIVTHVGSLSWQTRIELITSLKAFVCTEEEADEHRLRVRESVDRS